MKPTNLWRVMTPIRGAAGRYWHTEVVALHRTEAIRVAEQAAGMLGFSFDGDIQVDHAGRAYTEDGGE